MTYRAVRNAIVDETGKQLAIVVPVNCSKKLAAELAAYAAQQANHHVRDMQRRTEKTNQPGDAG